MARRLAVASWKQTVSSLKKELDKYALQASKKGEVLKAMGLEQRLSVRNAFKNERSPEGKPWKKNDPFYKKWKDKKVGPKKILDLTGKLQKSFYTKIDGDIVKTGSKLSVAPIHQFGLGKLSERRFLGKDKDFEGNMKNRIKKIFKGIK
jgi:phage virion morphogenesis protein